MSALDKILDWKLGTHTNHAANGFLIRRQDFEQAFEELTVLRSEIERLKLDLSNARELLRRVDWGGADGLAIRKDIEDWLAKKG